MSNTILTPGYVRWTGTAFVTDPTVEIVGPPGADGADGLPGPAGSAGLPGVDNIAALKSFSLPSNHMGISVKGYYVPGDGGQGDFYWDASSSDTDNSGTIIALNIGGIGRWKRIYSNTINVKWFGAKGDGSTDDTLAIQAAINLAGLINTTTSTIYFSGGDYLITSTINIPGGVRLKGDGNSGNGLWSVIRHAAPNGVNCLEMTATPVNSGGNGITDLLIARYSGFGGTALKIVASGSHGVIRPTHIRLANIRITNFSGTDTNAWTNGVWIDGHLADITDSKGIREIDMDQVEAALCTGDCFLLDTAVHVIGTDIIAQGQGVGTCVANFHIKGYSANIAIAQLTVGGDLLIEDNTAGCTFHGVVDGNINIGASCIAIGIPSMYGNSLTIANGATGYATGAWNTVINNNDAKFRVSNVTKSIQQIGNQVVAGGYVPSNLAHANANPSNAGANFNSVPIDPSNRQNGFFAEDPDGGGRNVFFGIDATGTRAIVGSPIITPIDFKFNNQPFGIMDSLGWLFGGYSISYPHAKVYTGSVLRGATVTTLPQDVTVRTTGLYAYDPDTTNSAFIGLGTDGYRAKCGSTNQTPVDFVYADKPLLKLNSSGIVVGGFDLVSPFTQRYSGSVIQSMTITTLPRDTTNRSNGLYAYDPDSTHAGTWGLDSTGLRSIGGSQNATPVDLRYNDVTKITLDSDGITEFTKLLKSRDTANTTNSTLTVLRTIPIPDQVAVIVTTKITGYESATGDSLAAVYSAGFKRHGAGVVVIQSGYIQNTVKKDSGANAWAVDIVTSGNNVLAEVQGENGKNIIWTAITTIDVL